MEFDAMLADKETVYWGDMTGWGPNEERRDADHLAEGYKFKQIRDMGGSIYYNLELKVYFRVESR